jgi:AAA domain
MCKDSPPLLDLLDKKYNITITGGTSILKYKIFRADLSQYKLRLTHRTPIIWVQLKDANEMSAQHLTQSLQDVAREGRFSDETAIVLLDTGGQELKVQFKLFYHRFVVIDSNEQETILNSRRPSGALLDIISRQVPLLLLSPYETSAYVSGSQFFGRKLEINRLTSNSNTNFVVTGIRRIGKTSLLKEVKRLLEKKEGANAPHIIYMDCNDYASNDSFIEDIVRKLDPRQLVRLKYQNYSFFFPAFLEQMKKKYKHRIVFFLDEIDQLAEMQTPTNNIFQLLRSASNKGACQFFVAGYRQAVRESNTADSPFYNFGIPIILGEFNRADANELIIKPMEGMRISLKDREKLVSRIYHETAGLPNLMQVYCQILLEKLEQSNSRELSEKNLIGVYENSRLHSNIRTSFLQNTEPVEKLITYALLKELGQDLSRSFTPRTIDSALKKKGVITSQASIESACQTLSYIGFFMRKSNEITFTSPIFAKILIEMNLDYCLMKAKEEYKNV